MTINEYQVLAMRTAPKQSEERALVNAAMGLCGESGEVCDIIKKHVFQGHKDLNKDKLIEEAGDVAWYLAMLATSLGVPLEEILQGNIDKLKKRYPGEGFEAERSVNRSEYVLTREDLEDFIKAYPPLSMVALANIENKDGVSSLVFDPKMKFAARIVGERIPTIVEWVEKRKGVKLNVVVKINGV